MTVTQLPVPQLPAPPTPEGEAAEDILSPALPHDIAAERAVLGALLIDRRALDDVSDTGLQPQDHHRPAHELIHRAVLAAAAAGRPDVVTVAERLQAAGDLTRAGGPAYLHTLSHDVPTAANAAYYARIVRDRAVERRLVTAGVRIQQLGRATGDLDDRVSAAHAELAAVADAHRGPDGDVDMGAALDDLMDELEAGGGTYVPTGLTDLDDAFNGGLRPGTITTVGARPAVGKTVLGLSVALHAAITAATPVGFTSLEMSRSDLLLRAAASLGSLDYSRLQQAQVGKLKLTESEWRAVARANARVRESRLEIHDRGVRVAHIRASIRAMQRRHGSCGLWVIDYLGLITPDDTRVNREQQVSQMSRALKLTALELDVPILLLHQLNRESERGAREPRMSDLRDSGSVEQDSDGVVLLHRDLEQSPQVLGANVAKNRRGRTAGLVLDFHGAHQRVVTHQWRPSDAAGAR